jgi:hypothetical protein
VTSDTLDIRGPIPLTRAGLQVRPVVSFIFVFCNLAPVNAWHTACPRSEFSLCSGFRGRYRDKTHGNLKGLGLVVMNFLGLCSGATLRVRTF